MSPLYLASGALPFMTEMIGYTGPIYMTHPTKAIAPILLEDMRKSKSTTNPFRRTFRNQFLLFFSCRRAERRDKLLHDADDQRLHEESYGCDLASVGDGRQRDGDQSVLCGSRAGSRDVLD